MQCYYCNTIIIMKWDNVVQSVFHQSFSSSLSIHLYIYNVYVYMGVHTRTLDADLFPTMLFISIGIISSIIKTDIQVGNDVYCEIVPRPQNCDKGRRAGELG